MSSASGRPGTLLGLDFTQDELDEYIIIEVKKRPVIFDRSSPDFKNKFLKTNAYKEIASEIEKRGKGKMTGKESW